MSFGVWSGGGFARASAALHSLSRGGYAGRAVLFVGHTSRPQPQSGSITTTTHYCYYHASNGRCMVLQGHRNSLHHHNRTSPFPPSQSPDWAPLFCIFIGAATPITFFLHSMWMDNKGRSVPGVGRIGIGGASGNPKLEEMERILAAAQTRESELAEQVTVLKRKLAATEMELAELRVRLERC